MIGLPIFLQGIRIGPVKSDQTLRFVLVHLSVGPGHETAAWLATSPACLVVRASGTEVNVTRQVVFHTNVRHLLQGSEIWQ